MIRTAILGASGYVGGELLRLIAAHPELAPAKLFGDSKAGQPLGAVHPHLAAAYPRCDLREVCEGSARRRSTSSSPRFRMATASGSRRTILDRGIPFVDLGADFRLDDAATYERWYGHAHEAPELLGSFVYGIPELNRDGDQEREGRRRRRLLRDRGDPRAEAAGRCRPGQAGQPDRRCRLGRQRRRPRGQGSDRLSARSTAASPPTACSTTATRPKWKWRSAARCCSRPHLVPMTRGILATCYGEATGAVRSARRRCAKLMPPSRSSM